MRLRQGKLERSASAASTMSDEDDAEETRPARGGSDQPKDKKLKTRQTFFVRMWMTFFMIGLFFLIMSLGHSVVVAEVYLLQVRASAARSLAAPPSPPPAPTRHAAIAARRSSPSVSSSTSATTMPRSTKSRGSAPCTGPSSPSPPSTPMVSPFSSTSTATASPWPRRRPTTTPSSPSRATSPSSSPSSSASARATTATKWVRAGLRGRTQHAPFSRTAARRICLPAGRPRVPRRHAPRAL